MANTETIATATIPNIGRGLAPGPDDPTGGSRKIGGEAWTGVAIGDYTSMTTEPKNRNPGK